MSYNHTTRGFEAFEVTLNTLRALSVYPTKVENLDKRVDVGLYDEERNLRTATFCIPWNGKTVVIEEYLAVHDCDCDGTDFVDIAIYEEGKRPDLESLLQEIPA